MRRGPRNFPICGRFACRRTRGGSGQIVEREQAMNGIIYIIGLIVVVIAVLHFLGVY